MDQEKRREALSLMKQMRRSDDQAASPLITGSTFIKSTIILCGNDAAAIDAAISQAIDIKDEGE